MITEEPARPYTDEFLQNFSSEHIRYEYQMFRWLGVRLESRQPPIYTDISVSVALNNALLEAFLLHTRNLIEFFFPERPRPTDVIAADFCLQNAWEPTAPSLIEEWRFRANKEINHITSRRISGISREKAWNFYAITVELEILVNRFREVALKERLSSEVFQNQE